MYNLEFSVRKERAANQSSNEFYKALSYLFVLVSQFQNEIFKFRFY